jgi:hypothetical protein
MEKIIGKLKEVINKGLKYLWNAYGSAKAPYWNAYGSAKAPYSPYF